MDIPEGHLVGIRKGRLIVKCTKYFLAMRKRPDRVAIKEKWIQQVIDRPAYEAIQKDGRVRSWALIDEMEGRFLRVILLEDGETVHNAFFDRRFKL